MHITQVLTTLCNVLFCSMHRLDLYELGECQKQPKEKDMEFCMGRSSLLLVWDV